MGKLNRAVTAARTGVSPITTVSATPDTFNADGLPAFTRDSKSELFLMAVGAFYGENKFYATASEESLRYATLVQTCTVADPAWTAAFLAWLRSDANIRTAALVGAAEYVRAGGPNGRSVVKSVIRRADEPGEVLAYWTSKYGRRVPQPIKRGVRDAAQLQYTERNAAKWDSTKASFRFADVIELTHPSPLTPVKSDLYRYLLEERHGRATFEGKTLTELEGRDRALRSEDPRAALLAEMVEKGNSCVTWETVSSAGGGQDVGPRVGALLRRDGLHGPAAQPAQPGPGRCGRRLQAPDRALPVRPGGGRQVQAAADAVPVGLQGGSGPRVGFVPVQGPGPVAGQRARRSRATGWCWWTRRAR